MSQKLLSFKEYPFLVERKGVWREIARYVSQDLGSIESILEIGAGYCDFINEFPARQKICFELNKERRSFAAPEVEFRCGDAVKLMDEFEMKVNCIFASNFLEHLSSEQHHDLLPGIYKGLEQNGRLVLIQPNYRLCQTTYFDDPTHQSVFSDNNISNFLDSFGFQIIKLIPNFLPFSMKSKIPKWPFLVRLYLHSPIKPKGAQMYVVAQKR